MAEAMYAGARPGADGSGVSPEHGTAEDMGAAASEAGAGARGAGDDVVDAEFRATDEKK